MNFRFNTVQEEDEWEIITADWWRTAFISVPWTYVPSDVTKGKSPLRRQFHGSLFAGLSRRARRNIYSDDVLCKFSENDTLNPELVGVCGAMAAVTSYEEDVGFSYSTCPTIEPHELNLFTRVDLSINIDENDLLTGRQRWKELVDDLMNGESDLTLSSVDFSSSDGSIDSFVMPSTPKAKHIFTDIEVKVSSPNDSIDGGGFDNSDFLPPGKSLNAAASSFVPTLGSQSCEAVHFPPLVDASKSSSPTLSFATFTFPTLNAPQATVRLNKDEQGFFTDVQKEPSNPDEPTKLLPPFLQESPHRNRPRKSRTREIVDRLRSTTSLDDSTTAQIPLSNNGIELSQKYASHSPSPIPRDGSFMMPRLSVSEDGDRASGLSTPSEDDDGWISQPNTLSPHHKARRTRETRELFLALTRRRTDSLSSENLKALLDSTYDDSSALPPRNTSAPTSPSPQTPPPLTSGDGWIESNPPLPKSQKKSKSSSRESHRRKTSSIHNSSSSSRAASLSTPSTSSSSHFLPSVNSTTSACFSPPSPHHHHRHHHHHPTVSPHMAPQQQPPQAIPYFFSAVATPIPYTAFMHFPAFPISIPMHGHTGLPVNGVSTPYGTTSPALITRRAAGSVNPLMPTYRG